MQAGGDGFALVAPVATTMVFGFLLLTRTRANRQKSERLRPGIRVSPVDAGVARDATLLSVGPRRKGWQLATIDALTAVVSPREGLTLLTTDGDFSTVPHDLTKEVTFGGRLPHQECYPSLPSGKRGEER